MRTTWERVLAWRLGRHHLAERDGPSAVDVVRRLTGVQAQVASSARQAVAVRGPAGGAVDDALEARALMRTWAARGTLHLLPPDQAADQLALLAAARTWEKGAWQKAFATATEMSALAEAADRVLTGAVLTRDELVDAVGAAVEPSTADTLASGWGTLLKPLAWQGVLCNGPPRGTRPTFTSPRSWVPGWNGLPDADAAAHRVIPAYLGAHGPASPATFDAWLLRGATPKARLRRWFAELVDAGTLRVVDVDGEPLHARTADLDALASAAPVPGVRLLPAFDPWVLAPGTNDSRVVPTQHRGVVSRAAGWIAPVVVVGGRVVGTWTLSGGEPVIDLFADSAPLDPDALAAETAWWRAVSRPRP